MGLRLWENRVVNENNYSNLFTKGVLNMLFLKIIFFPIYLPFAIIVNIFKCIGMASLANDFMDFLDER